MIKKNLFKVDFLDVPGMDIHELSMLGLLTLKTCIPGSEENWYIEVIAENFDIYEKLRLWQIYEENRSNEPHKFAQANIYFYNVDGTTSATYNFQNIMIKSISCLYFDWTEDSKDPQNFEVRFAVGKISKV